MTRELADEVRRLFSLVERNVTYEDIKDAGSPAVTVGVRPGDTYTLREEGYYLLVDLAEVIARPGYATPGLSLEGARSLLLNACTRSLRDGPEAAVNWLLEELDSSPRVWIVARPISIGARDTPFAVGAARVQRGLPESLGRDDDSHVARDFPSFSISCEVEAWDREAAILFADRVFQDSVAILQLADRRGQARLGSAVVTLSEGMNTYSPRTDPAGDVFAAVSSTGSLLGGVGALSAASVKEDQTDWERRTLAAARWLTRGLGTSSPGDAVVSLMTALEALFIQEKSRKKKNKISQAVRKVVQLRGMSPEELGAWIEDLYDRRNYVIHEGVSYDDEIQVSRLADVVWICVRWAAHHLRPFHGLSDRPCESIDEVTECEKRTAST